MMTACGSSDKAAEGLTFETYEKNGDATFTFCETKVFLS